MTDSEKGLPTAAEADYVTRENEAVGQSTRLELWPKEMLYHIDEKTELVRRSDVKALIESEGITLYECSICGYISSDVQEVADCCDTDAIYYDFIRKIDLIQKVEGEA